MTIKDVLRETAGGDSGTDEVPLDDKKAAPKQRLFGGNQKANRFVEFLFGTPGKNQRNVAQRLAIVAAVLCFATIVTLTVRALIPVHHSAKVAATIPVKPAPQPSMTSTQASLLKLMPAKIGDWTRNEATADLWKDENVGNSTVQTYVSTYRLGSARVELWAVRAPKVGNSSPLVNFECAPRAVHTDSGVQNVTPQVTDIGSNYFVTFDYYPEHAADQFLIMTNQTFGPQLPHTISWYQAPYIVTVAATSKEDRDAFEMAMAPKLP